MIAPSRLGLALASSAIALSLAGPALAQANATGHYRSLPESEVRAIEYDLIWVGATDAVADGRIGRTDIERIQDFERNNNLRADGVLRPRERRVLARQAQRARAELGYETIRDERTGVRMGLPRALVGPRADVVNGSRWKSPDGRLEVFAYRVTERDLEQVYAGQMNRPGREVTYDVLRDDFFVVAGRENRRSFYYRAGGAGDEVRAFAIVYDDERDRRIEALIAAMSNDFVAFPGQGGRTAPPRGADRGAAGACGERYRVRRGDTMFAIALRCSTTLPGLLRANPRVDPLSLRVGQELVVSAGTGAFPPAPVAVEDARPSVSLVSRAPGEGGALRVRASGFAPGEVVEAGFGRDALSFVVRRVARADATGDIVLDMTLPDGFRAGERVVVSFATPRGERGASSEPFTVASARAPIPAPRDRLVITGMLTSEGTRCTTLRDVDGRLFTLAGSRSDYAPGTAVRVEALAGTDAQVRRCGQGTTVEVLSAARR